MRLSIFQKGFNYGQDGPGNRLVYHLQGCNFRCPWCANPESLDAAGACLSVDVHEVLNEIRRSRALFIDGGGVTFTGGEPTLQFGALKFLLKALRDEGIHTAMETNASSPRLPALFPLVDHLIMDIKHPFAEQHAQYMGFPIDPVRKNICAALHAHPDVLLHIPLINGYNASPEDARGFAQVLSAMKAPRIHCEILRYHEYGRDKWKALGLPYRVSNGHVTDAQVSYLSSLLSDYGISMVRT